ncbi:arsenite methyltransferase [candidate division KSB1 bacterium]|nr:arsenite methyltransferase [candidate division KSB1 bacterium]
MTTPDNIHTIVRERYAEAANGPGCGCGSGGCCGADLESVDDIALMIGYDKSDLAAIPAGANLGLGCGNPLAHAELQAGDVVLDLGSGAGFDCFLAAPKVGPSGRVIGVDMTPAMLDRARENARKGNYTNVEFRLGQIEHLPVRNSEVTVIISNCVVNLSPDKPQVFREAFRALKPGGKLLLSDLVLTRPLSPALQSSVEAYVGCVAGASLKADYLSDIRLAGFASVEIVQEQRYDVGLNHVADALRKEALEAVVSVKVRAIKPLSSCC